MGKEIADVLRPPAARTLAGLRNYHRGKRLQTAFQSWDVVARRSLQCKITTVTSGREDADGEVLRQEGVRMIIGSSMKAFLFSTILRPFTLPGLALCLSLGACAGPGFNTAWKKAATAQRSAPAPGITGAWEGSWLSAMNGHNGKLRCLVEPGTDKDTYRFRYHATWQGCLSGGFTSDTLVKPAAGGYTLTSHEDLGPFGTFDQKGTAKGGTMKSHYTSSMGDHGSFTLKRPQ